MTPAEELAAAADKLAALASHATPDLGSFDTFEDVLFPEDLAYIAAMNPLVGKALVEHMRHEAEWSERYALNGLRFDGHPALLEIARLIIGGAS